MKIIELPAVIIPEKRNTTIFLRQRISGNNNNTFLLKQVLAKARSRTNEKANFVILFVVRTQCAI